MCQGQGTKLTLVPPERLEQLLDRRMKIQTGDRSLEFSLATRRKRARNTYAWHGAHTHVKGTRARSAVTLSCIRQSGGFLRHAEYCILKLRHLSWKWSNGSRFARGACNPRASRSEAKSCSRGESTNSRTFGIPFCGMHSFHKHIRKTIYIYIVLYRCLWKLHITKKNRENSWILIYMWYMTYQKWIKLRSTVAFIKNLSLI